MNTFKKSSIPLVFGKTILQMVRHWFVKLFLYSITEDDPQVMKVFGMVGHFAPTGLWLYGSRPPTFLPFIQAHVANGTIIHSDQWSAYWVYQTLQLMRLSTIR